MKQVARAALMLGCLCAVAQAQPVQWSSADGGNDNWYQAVVSAESVTWLAADMLAALELYQGAPGHLVTVTSEAENNWVLELISPTRTWWTGGIQAVGADEPDGGWGWVTGEPMTYEGWCPTEPSNTVRNEDRICYPTYGVCVGGWDDVFQRSVCGGFVVEWESESVSSDELSWGSVKSWYSK